MGSGDDKTAITCGTVQPDIQAAAGLQGKRSHGNDPGPDGDRAGVRHEWRGYIAHVGAGALDDRALIHDVFVTSKEVPVGIEIVSVAG